MVGDDSQQDEDVVERRVVTETVMIRSLIDGEVVSNGLVLKERKGSSALLVRKKRKEQGNEQDGLDKLEQQHR